MSYPDRLILFDLVGHMAHFRRFYTNSSSLSYSFPPRTTICGLVAGILGKQRDSYYEEFSTGKCRVGVAVRTPVRKIVQIVNYVRTKGLSEINASAGHTQVPLELVLPKAGYEKLKYRIYFWHKNITLMEELWKRLRGGKFIYPPYLGITECPAEIPWTTLVDGDNLSWLSNPNRLLQITTVIPVERLSSDSLELHRGLQLFKERQPLDFASGRSLAAVANMLYERNAKPVELILNGDIFQVFYKDLNGQQEEYGIFMEV